MGINLAIKTVILAIMLNAYLQTCRPVCKKLQTGLQTDCRPVADRLQKVADRSYKGPIHRSQITLDHTPLPTPPLHCHQLPTFVGYRISTTIVLEYLSASAVLS